MVYFYAGGYSGPSFYSSKDRRVGVCYIRRNGRVYRQRNAVYGDVLGDWKNNRWAIDMTLLEHKGQLYAVWSGWENSEPTDKTQQHLYIAKMENPWTMASGRVKNIVTGPLL